MIRYRTMLKWILCPLLGLILISCNETDPLLIEEVAEPEPLFLEGEFIQLDSTGSLCDWFFQTETESYHLGNEYDLYFQYKSALTDTQQVVVRYDSIVDGSICNEDLIQSTVANLELYERLELFINNDQFNDNDTRGIFIDSAYIVGDYLFLDYNSSGCQRFEWEPYLVDSEEVLESFPEQRNLKLVTHEIGGCQTVINKTGIFNLQLLRVEGNAVTLNIAHSFEESISITYSY